MKATAQISSGRALPSESASEPLKKSARGRESKIVFVIKKFKAKKSLGAKYIKPKQEMKLNQHDRNFKISYIYISILMRREREIATKISKNKLYMCNHTHHIIYTLDDDDDDDGDDDDGHVENEIESGEECYLQLKCPCDRRWF
jgi:hypothetical protein